mmetsp:Transcript_2015/g.5900  ORF Transcript_2015/g.5900 Transcript_2015/m.5900 type:complete len:204 (+) Transcript_2015:66-677(+)
MWCAPCKKCTTDGGAGHPPGKVAGVTGHGHGDDLDTCGIDALNAALEDLLRCDEELGYDAGKGAILMRGENYTLEGEPLETAGANLRTLVDDVNKSIREGMRLPLQDGRTVSLQLDFDWSEGAESAEPGSILLVKEADDDCNHFMEFEKAEDGIVYARNSRARHQFVQVPSTTFEAVLYTYSLRVSHVEVSGGDSDEESDEMG